MGEQQHIDYNRIALAIEFIRANHLKQPTLDEIADKVHLSPFHFQRMFSDWAGVSPKKFLQFISVQYAKQILSNSKSTLFETALQTGLSGTSRLHDLFLNIEGMTPGEYKSGGKNLQINYSFAESPFGSLMVASTPKGICSMTFENDEKMAFQSLQARFPNASFSKRMDLAQQNALLIFHNDWSKLNEIKLHLNTHLSSC